MCGSAAASISSHRSSQVAKNQPLDSYLNLSEADARYLYTQMDEVPGPDAQLYEVFFIRGSRSQTGPGSRLPRDAHRRVSNTLQGLKLSDLMVKAHTREPQAVKVAHLLSLNAVMPSREAALQSP